MDINQVTSSTNKPCGKNILYVSSAGTSGYAIASKNIIFNYLQNGYNVTFVPVIVDNSKFDFDDIITSKVNDCKSTVYDSYDYFIIHFVVEPFRNLYKHCNDIEMYKKSKDCKVILQTVWETTTLPPRWAEIMNDSTINEIWVPSEFNKKIFEDGGVKTKIVVKRYMSYNFVLEKPKNEVIIPSNIKYGNKDITKTFNFYSISSWTERKNYKNTIREFCKTFTSADNVCYLIKATSEYYTEHNKSIIKREFEEIIQEFPNPPDFTLFLDNYNNIEMNEIHNLGDCYYLLHRGEGLGISSYDAFLNHKSVIVTKFGGHVEYFPENYPYFVDCSMVKVDGMKETVWYNHDHQWAEPNYEHARELLKLIYNRNCR